MNGCYAPTHRRAKRGTSREDSESMEQDKIIGVSGVQINEQPDPRGRLYVAAGGSALHPRLVQQTLQEDVGLLLVEV